MNGFRKIRKFGLVGAAIAALVMAGCANNDTPTATSTSATTTSPAATSSATSASTTEESESTSDESESTSDESESSEDSATSSSSEGSGASGSATVMITDGALGSYLTDPNGMTLYMFEADTDGTSTCYDQCATAWPPLTVTGDPVAGDGVDQGLLTTVERTDGTLQVKYGEYPLYYFFKDAAAGDTNGQGSTGAGAPWWVVGADGEPIMTPAAATSSS